MHTVALFVIGGSSAILTEILAAYASEDDSKVTMEAILFAWFKRSLRVKKHIFWPPSSADAKP